MECVVTGLLYFTTRYVCLESYSEAFQTPLLYALNFTSVLTLLSCVRVWLGNSRGEAVCELRHCIAYSDYKQAIHLGIFGMTYTALVTLICTYTGVWCLWAEDSSWVVLGCLGAAVLSGGGYVLLAEMTSDLVLSLATCFSVEDLVFELLSYRSLPIPSTPKVNPKLDGVFLSLLAWLLVLVLTAGALGSW
jgi:hypothetical protein